MTDEKSNDRTLVPMWRADGAQDFPVHVRPDRVEIMKSRGWTDQKPRQRQKAFKTKAATEEMET